MVAYFVDSELPSPPGPAGMVKDLAQPIVPVGTRRLSYVDEPAQQIGTAGTNDFILGPLHSVRRDVLFAALKAVQGWIFGSIWMASRSFVCNSIVSSLHATAL